jgi:hypothetical protein
MSYIYIYIYGKMKKKTTKRLGTGRVEEGPAYNKYKKRAEAIQDCGVKN